MKFNHWEALKIAFNALYIASFIALIMFSVSTAKKSQIDYDYSEEKYCPCGYDGSYIACSECDCQNCDEID